MDVISSSISHAQMSGFLIASVNVSPLRDIMYFIFSALSGQLSVQLSVAKKKKHWPTQMKIQAI